MRIVQINAVPYGSTGRIMFQLADALEHRGDEVLCTAGFTWKKSSREDFFITSNIFEKTAHTYLARLTGRIGGFSVLATRRLLKRLDAFRPDLIHLHNLHGWFINIPMLFNYIREKDIPVVWTLHDCWSFTGHCPHFQGIGCEKWKTGCHDCPLYRLYPDTYFDYSKRMYRTKKKWLSGVNRMTIVTPSRWLAGCVKESFLSDYRVHIIPNGINLSVFSAGAKKADKRSHTILGVAYAWNDKKGLDVFIELRKRLGEDFRIVLVGTDEAVDRQLPEGIVSVHRTQSQKELAELYREADVFVNPTREDNLPTVNMEALACGTPVITFDTGGSPEIPDETCGIVVPKNDIDALELEIRRVCTERPFSRQQCLERAKTFDEGNCIRQYLELYRSMV